MSEVRTEGVLLSQSSELSWLEYFTKETVKGDCKVSRHVTGHVRLVFGFLRALFLLVKPYLGSSGIWKFRLSFLWGVDVFFSPFIPP